MEIDPDRIERTDFSTSWRGYDRAEVDAHLREVAAAMEALRRRVDSSTRAGSLSSAADERLRPILDAAEESAGEILSEAEDEARRLVGRVEQRTSDLLGRADSLDSELDDLVSRLRTAAATAAESLRRDVLAMQDELAQLPGGQPPLPPGSESSTRVPEEIQAEPPRAREGLHEPEGDREELAEPEEDREELSEPEGDREPIGDRPQGPTEDSSAEREPPSSTRSDEAVRAGPSAELETEGEEEPAPATPSAGGPPTAADLEGARLIALNMALAGSPREETADYLRQTLGFDDRALLDEVYERARAR
jgi:DivIVA domain-containing protein